MAIENSSLSSHILCFTSKPRTPTSNCSGVVCQISGAEPVSEMALRTRHQSGELQFQEKARLFSPVNFFPSSSSQKPQQQNLSKLVEA
ncbi:hypothetical protein HZ326_20932 [Fusarium oxysporum f. sp. albedinis]|nr:hypothetical protein HZ326_20932 [Fusarium oxysporum f. sp. albedinis]